MRKIILKLCKGPECKEEAFEALKKIYASIPPGQTATMSEFGLRDPSGQSRLS